MSHVLVLAVAAILGPPPQAFEPSSPLEVARKLATTKFEGYRYGSKGKKRVNCVQFVHAVVEALAKERKVEITRETRDRIHINQLTAREMKALDRLVEKGDPRIRGVRHALVKAGLGKAVPTSKARPGDFVQYWYRTKAGWRGHAGLVESIDRKGRATIYGSHKTTLQSDRKKPKAERKGGIGPGPVFDLTDTSRKVWVVRWTK